MHFYRWLVDQTGRPDPVGRFAERVAHDPRWPKRFVRIHAILTYLRTEPYWRQALKWTEAVLLEAHKEYRSFRRKNIA